MREAKDEFEGTCWRQNYRRGVIFPRERLGHEIYSDFHLFFELHVFAS